MFSQFVEAEEAPLKAIAAAVRGLCLDAVLQSQSGHIGLPLGAAEIGTLLYFGVMDHNPDDPGWIDRDRFVLSAGHGSALQYALLNLCGYGVTRDDLIHFRQLGSPAAGHPEYGLAPGVECTTGPLGQGFAMAVGMALGEAHLSSRFKVPVTHEAPIDHRTFVLAGDGCLMEGVSYEAASLAGHLGLNRLIVLYDDNRITIDGHTDISFSENVPDRFRAMGWNVFHAEGNNFKSLGSALDQAYEQTKKPHGQAGPSLIVCRTVPGKVLARWENNPKVHGNPHTAEDVRAAKETLGLPPDQHFFVLPATQEHAQRLMQQRRARHGRWTHSLSTLTSRLGDEAAAEWKSRFGPAIEHSFNPEQLENSKTAAATRQSSGMALQFAAEDVCTLIGGSADLAGSNASTLKNSEFIAREDYSGRNIHFGVREHAMGAITNGLALHGGLRPYCATFAVFSDYMRPAIRLAALMGIPSLFIFTHDSYAVGEDGPTHQPIEHAASLRAVPQLQVLRPADGPETFAAWQCALNTHAGPTALLLTRQKTENLDALLETHGLPARSWENILRGFKAGAYLLKDHSRSDARHLPTQKITLVTSGSETADALRAAFTLESLVLESLSPDSPEASRLSVRVVSAPAVATLLNTPEVLHHLLPLDQKIIAIEAGCSQGMAGVVGRDGYVLGLNRFGESAPYAILKEHFGYTPDALVERILSALGVRQKPEAE